jgi:hypothetical protein
MKPPHASRVTCTFAHVRHTLHMHAHTRTSRSSVRDKDVLVPYLEEQEWRAEHLGRPRHIKNELVESRERQLRRIPKCSSRTSASAIMNSTPSPVHSTASFAALELPEPPGER